MMLLLSSSLLRQPEGVKTAALRTSNQLLLLVKRAYEPVIIDVAPPVLMSTPDPPVPESPIDAKSRPTEWLMRATQSLQV